MKKRKSPVALLTVLILAVGGLLIMSRNFGFYSKSTQEQMEQLQEEQRAKIEAQSASKPADPSKVDMKQQDQAMSKALGKSNKGPDGAPVADGGDTSKSSEPTILLPEDTVYIPKPNESATSSQWYDKDKK